jgi:hypothetical protein
MWAIKSIIKLLREQDVGSNIEKEKDPEAQIVVKQFQREQLTNEYPIITGSGFVIARNCLDYTINYHCPIIGWALSENILNLST